MNNNALYLDEQIASPDSARGTPEATASADASVGRASKSARSPKSLELFNAYQEYFDRLETGEEIDPDEFCARHSHLQSSLAQLLQLHSFLEENDALAATTEYPEVGSSFLHFTLLHELGEGAFAKVFLAYDNVLGRHVALKLSRRAKAEAMIMGSVEHANIVMVHSIAEDQPSGLTAICMPYRGGATVDDVLDAILARPEMPEKAAIILDAARQLPMPLDGGSGAPNPILQAGPYLDGIRSIGAQIADALAYLHARNIYHCDLKPSNILVTPNGTPMLLDFNLSTDFQREPTPFGGTLPYMAPEVLATVGLHEHAAITAKADIYSFGVILYQLVTGKHPLGVYSLKLKTLELRDHLLARQKLGVTPACEVNPRVDRPLSNLIQRCLALHPEDRPESAQAIASALQSTAPKGPFSFRHRMMAWTGVLLCLLFLGATGLVGIRNAPTVEEKLQAAEQSYRQGSYPETLDLCGRLVTADPNSERAIYLSARAKQKLGQVSGQKDFFEKAITDYHTLDQKPSDGRYKAAIGYCSNAVGRHPVALTAYQHALKSGYENAEVHNNIGFCLTKTNKLRDAIRAFDRAIELNEKLAIPYYNRGCIALNLAFRNLDGNAANANQGDERKPIDLPNLTIENGIDDFRQAIAKGEQSASIYFDAATLCAIAAHTDQTHVEDALAYLKKSLERGQSSSSLKHFVFDSMRKQIVDAKLGDVVATVAKSPPPTRFLDPILD